MLVLKMIRGMFEAGAEDHPGKQLVVQVVSLIWLAAPQD